MSRLIDADKVVERMSAAFRTQMEVCDEDTRRTLKLFIDFLEEVIPEQPMVNAIEVVRCMDCKYWQTEACVMDDWNFSDTTGSDYCSRGERKE